MLPIYISTFIGILSKLNEISGYLKFVEMKTVIEICVQFRVFYILFREFFLLFSVLYNVKTFLGY